MIGTIINFLLYAIAIFFVIVTIGSLFGLFGCAGDCNQGRQECDCKDDHE